ncbi:spike base protein, RCAP_Rcc01079 family [Sphingomonas montana]|uniref:spike base protein, RCAP_Rcc01079 family n=1 Tax=Sphingomonas montana TaxID=1843236 RepID=UPI00096CD904|nr:hypothetical protein [Sphingomonas montana]
MNDGFADRADTLSAPSRSATAVVPSDSMALARLPKALYVGTGGHVTLRCVDDATDVTFRNVPSGAIIRARASHVRAAGTTAADIVAHY